MEQVSAQVQQFQERLSDAESDREVGRQPENAPPRHGESRVEQAFRDEVGRLFARICSEFDSRDVPFNQLWCTVHDHRWHDLELLLREQEQMKEQVLELQHGRQLVTQIGEGYQASPRG